MEKINNLEDFLKNEIEDLYSVEEQILEALPVMIDKAVDRNLKNALSEHLRQTQEHKKRLDNIQQILKQDHEEKKGIFASLFGGKKVCKGMQGIIEEGNKMMSEDMDKKVLDAVIIASAQKVEHYEICGYGTARTYARELNMSKVASILEATLNEEYEADKKLTALAERRINAKAETPTERKNSKEAGSHSNKSKSESGSARSKKQEPQMESVSSRNSSSKGNGKGGKPKGTASRSSTSRASSQSGSKKGVKSKK